jgi:NAD(P)-dependent dehydrogenase (short-subunit alcohol dehydrogenase family)
MAAEAKTVLVTGAAGGLGGATVERLHELGWRVFAGIRSPEAGEELARGGQAIPVVFDLCDGDSIARSRNQVSAELGDCGLDALVNAAGLVVQGPLELVPLEALRRQFEVNVIGQIAVTQAFLPLLRAVGGRVVNVSGAAARVSLPMLGAISASKAALESLSDALRMELKHQGIAVSVVTPGLMRTELHQKSDEARRRDGYAGGPEEQGVYTEAIAASDHALADSKEASVEIGVEAIVKALSDPRPATRYLVGRDTKQLAMLARLPDRLRDRLLMWNRGLKAERFVVPSGGAPRRVAPNSQRGEAARDG